MSGITPEERKAYFELEERFSAWSSQPNWIEFDLQTLALAISTMESNISGKHLREYRDLVKAFMDLAVALTSAPPEKESE